MKHNLMVIAEQETELWQAFVAAKKKAETTGSLADGVEMKRCLQEFFCFNNPVIQQNLRAL